MVEITIDTLYEELKTMKNTVVQLERGMVDTIHEMDDNVQKEMTSSKVLTAKVMGVTEEALRSIDMRMKTLENRVYTLELANVNNERAAEEKGRREGWDKSRGLVITVIGLLLGILGFLFSNFLVMKEPNPYPKVTVEVIDNKGQPMQSTVTQGNTKGGNP